MGPDVHGIWIGISVCQVFYEGSLTPAGNLIWGTWQCFSEEMDKALKGLNLQCKAAETLLWLRIETDRNDPETSFVEYKILARDVAMPRGDQGRVCIHVSSLDQLMPCGLRDHILMLNPLPATFADHRAVVLCLYVACKEGRDRQTRFKAIHQCGIVIQDHHHSLLASHEQLPLPRRL